MTILTRREGLAAFGSTVAAVAMGANAAQAASTVSAAFDQSNIKWNTIEGVPHVWYQILSVDRDAKNIDAIFKFAANERIFLHKHVSDYSTFIIQGELRLYNDRGELTEVRPTANFAQKKGGGAPHTEGGGDQDCIAWFNFNGTDGELYEVLGPDGEVVGAFAFSDFEALFQSQSEPVQPIIPG